MKKLVTSIILIAFMFAASAVSAAVTEDTIYACVKKNNGQVRIVTETEPCGPSENRISWNIAGLPGSGAAPQVLEAVQSAMEFGHPGEWLTIPGLELVFPLVADTPVNLSASGSVRIAGNGRVYFRFLVDGNPTGYGNDGLVYPAELMLDQTSGSTYRFWRIERDLQLSAGDHTIIVQMWYTQNVSQMIEPGMQSVLRVRY